MSSHRRSVGVLAGSLLALTVGVAPALAASTPPPRVPVTGAASVPNNAVLLPPVISSQPLQLRINLGLRDPAAAERYAAAVATPGSPDYHRFLGEAAFQSRFGAPASQITALRAWLSSQKIQVDQVIGAQIILAHGSTASVASAFDTHIRLLRTAGTQTRPVAVTPLRVPARFAGLISGVTGLAPTRQFQTASATVGPRVVLRSDAAPAKRSAAVPPSTNPNCPGYFGQFPVTGVPRPPFAAQALSYVECSLVRNPFTGAMIYAPGASTAKLRVLARVNPNYTGRGVTVGVVLWNNDFKSGGLANYGAYTNRIQYLRPGQLTRVLTSAGGPNCQPVAEEDKTEINLDIQSVHSFAPDAGIRFYGSKQCVVPDVSIAMALAEPRPPSVLTNSWGSANVDYDPADPVARSLHTSLVKAAIRGVSVLFSSGDTGDGTLLRRNYSQVSPPAPYPARTPGYPATDPYAVAVGSVGFGTDALGRTAFKQAWIPTYYSNPPGNPNWYVLTPRIFGGGPNAIGTTGGTSRVFGAPPWQRAAGVSTTGRRIPDLSNAGDPFFGPEFIAIAQPGSDGIDIITVGGTSMAAPLTAAQVATANEYRHNPYLGLITPSLYRLRASTAVSDVSHVQTGVVVKGFFPNRLNLLVGEELPQESLRATPAWDNATGLGTPSTGFIGNISR